MLFFFQNGSTVLNKAFSIETPRPGDSFILWGINIRSSARLRNLGTLRSIRENGFVLNLAIVCPSLFVRGFPIRPPEPALNPKFLVCFLIEALCAVFRKPFPNKLYREVCPVYPHRILLCQLCEKLVDHLSKRIVEKLVGCFSSAEVKKSPRCIATFRVRKLKNSKYRRGVRWVLPQNHEFLR